MLETANIFFKILLIMIEEIVSIPNTYTCLQHGCKFKESY